MQVSLYMAHTSSKQTGHEFRFEVRVTKQKEASRRRSLLLGRGHARGALGPAAAMPHARVMRMRECCMRMRDAGHARTTWAERA